MHCATCGGDNEPSARFCGGCGGKLAVAERPRVAPTAKISDFTPAAPDPPDPPAPPDPSPPKPHATHSYTNLPEDFGPIGRRTLPIALILVVDIALAIAGSAMLAKGLSKPTLREAPNRDAAPPPFPGADAALHQPLDASSPTGGSAAAQEPEAPESPKRDPKSPPSPRQNAGQRSTRNSTGPAPSRRPPNSPSLPSSPGLDSGGVAATLHDPAQTLANEIELATSRTQPEFDGCYAGVGGARAVHGSITIAFRVLTDGRVANIAAVENKTESVELAACLVAAIGRWSFVSRPTSPASFARTFTYR